jgi:RHS repeat-associated protein
MKGGSYYQPFLHLWVASGGLSRHPLYDAQGTVRRVVDDSAVQTDFYTHNAFGYEYPPSGTTPNPYRFGGAWGYIADPSGMLQLGARFYWPEVGRFVQRDPVRQGMDQYVYSRSDPLGQTDPTGLQACPDCELAYNACMGAAAAKFGKCTSRVLGIGFVGGTGVLGCLAGCAVSIPVTGGLTAGPCLAGCGIGSAVIEIVNLVRWYFQCVRPFWAEQKACQEARDACTHEY